MTENGTDTKAEGKKNPSPFIGRGAEVRGNYDFTLKASTAGPLTLLATGVASGA
jgi:hypothetical protein